MSLDAIYHALDPIAFSVGPFSVRWYGIAYVLGFVLGAVVVWRTQRRWHLNLTLDDLLTLMIGIALGVIIGGRLGYCLFYGDGYYFAHPLHIFMTFEGGMSFHGGLIGGILGGWISCKFTGLSPRTMLDLGLMAAPLGLFFGRCANFVNGELWGKPTDLPWGVTFENRRRHCAPSFTALRSSSGGRCNLYRLANSFSQATCPSTRPYNRHILGAVWRFSYSDRVCPST